MTLCVIIGNVWILLKNERLLHEIQLTLGSIELGFLHCEGIEKTNNKLEVS